MFGLLNQYLIRISVFLILILIIVVFLYPILQTAFLSNIYIKLNHHSSSFIWFIF